MPTAYPFLVHWKREGVDKFPGIPFKQMVEHLIRELLDPSVSNKPASPEDVPALCDDPEKRLTLLFREIKSSLSGDHDACTLLDMLPLPSEQYPAIYPQMKILVLKAAELVFKEDLIRWGRMVHEAREKVIRGDDREAVLTMLGRQVLPSKRGGASLITGIQLRTLKTVYLEMQEAIKEVRRGSFVNQRRPERDRVARKKCFKFCPWAKEIFKTKEVETIYSLSPTDAAAQVIVKRLNNVMTTNITSARSLKNKLNKIRPLLC